MTAPHHANSAEPLRTGQMLPSARGLNRLEAARYVGISPTLFDELVEDGRMPQPKLINRRTVWDRLALDLAFAALPDREEENPWDSHGQGSKP